MEISVGWQIHYIYVIANSMFPLEEAFINCCYM